MTAKMRSLMVMRNLRFNWVRNPIDVLKETLKTVGVEIEIITKDEQVFETFRNKLYRRLNGRFYPLLKLLIPKHVIWQVVAMWIKIKCMRRDMHIYERVRKAILIFQPKDATTPTGFSLKESSSDGSDKIKRQECKIQLNRNVILKQDR